jgi:hypothetical protein
LLSSPVPDLEGRAYLSPVEAVEEVEGDTDGDVAGAVFAADAGCFFTNGIHDVKLLDFFVGAGGACVLCCAALCGAIRPAWQPTP